MSLGIILSISIEGEWMSLRTVRDTLNWNAIQPVRYAFKGRVRESDRMYVSVPDRVITDEFYGEYILQ